MPVKPRPPRESSLMEFNERRSQTNLKAAELIQKADIKEEAARKERQRLRLTDLGALYQHFTGNSDVPRNPSVTVQQSIKNPWIWVESLSGQMFLAYATYVWTDPTLSHLISFAFEVRIETGFIECRQMRWAWQDFPLSLFLSGGVGLPLGATVYGISDGAAWESAPNVRRLPRRETLLLTRASWVSTQWSIKIGGKDGAPYFAWIAELLRAKPLADIVFSFLALAAPTCRRASPPDLSSKAF
jgi:hypothetical protein